MSADQPTNPYANQNPAGPRASFPSGVRHPDPNDLVVYAMQFLTGEEAATVAHHLEHCAECRSEIARIQGDLAACALTVDMESPPAAARDRLMAQVAREKKIVPAALVPEPAQPGPIAAFGRAGSVFNIEERQPQRSSSIGFLGVAGWVIAAGLAVGVSFLYGDRLAMRNSLATQVGEIQRLNTDAASAHQLMDALTDPKAVRVTLTPTPLPKAGPIGGVTYNPQKGTLIFLASDLDPLQQYKTYELWVIPADGSAPIPAGTFHPDDQGNASVIMPDLPKGVAAKAFGITIEGDGGSRTPTPPIVMAGS